MSTLLVNEKSGRCLVGSIIQVSQYAEMNSENSRIELISSHQNTSSMVNVLNRYRPGSMQSSVITVTDDSESNTSTSIENYLTYWTNMKRVNVQFQ